MTKTSPPHRPRPFTPQSTPQRMSASRPTIVVGLIPGPTGAAALRYAARHSARSGLPLRLVTAFTGDKTNYAAGGDRSGPVRTAIDAARCQERALRRLHRISAIAEHEQVISRGEAAEVLTRVTGVDDLLVLGASRTDGALAHALQSRARRGPTITVIPARSGRPSHSGGTSAIPTGSPR